jgi:Uma2 family endonuclease
MAVLEARRFTVQEFERMGAAGIIDEDERVELLDGQIVQMTPIGVRHAARVTTLTRLFYATVGDRAVVSVQNPLLLSDLSLPQPDLVLLKPPEHRYERRRPVSEDVLLLVEVADTSGPRDRGVKLSLYAQAGIPEYWIVDLEKNLIEVHRSPAGDRYVSVEPLAPGDLVSPEAFPHIELEVSEILGGS